MPPSDDEIDGVPDTIVYMTPRSLNCGDPDGAISSVPTYYECEEHGYMILMVEEDWLELARSSGCLLCRRAG